MVPEDTLTGRPSNQASGPGQSARHADAMIQLLQSGVLKPGTRMITVSHAGVLFTADLLPSGMIGWNGGTFDNPSAFDAACRRTVGVLGRDRVGARVL